MDEQKAKYAFLVISRHLSKIDEEIENIRKELKAAMEKLDLLQMYFDSLFHQSLN